MGSDSGDSNEAQPAKPKTDKKVAVDPELDVTSDKFNPLKALTSPNFVLPVKKAKVFDNVAVFESFWRRSLSGETSTGKKKCKSYGFIDLNGNR